MKEASKIIAGIGMLIFVFLILANGKNAVAIVNSVAKNSVSGIKVLQGRG